MYRLADRYTDTEMETLVEKWRQPPEWLMWWINGVACGAVLGWALGAV